MHSIYLDHNSTTPTRPEALRAIADSAIHYGNPSSLHRPGQGALRLVEDAADSIRAGLGAHRTIADKTQVLFTSGGSESDAMLRTIARSNRDADASRSYVVYAELEHPAIVANLEPLFSEGFEKVILPTLPSGCADLRFLERIEPKTVAVATLMLAHNESGIIQPVKELSDWADGDCWVHTDAVQAVGKMPVDYGALGVSSMAISAHKFGGPRGVGALLLNRHLSFPPLWQGGGQERGMRPGTQSKSLIAGMGAAVERATRTEEITRIGDLADTLRQGLAGIEGCWILDSVTQNTHRLRNTIACGVRGRNARDLLKALEAQGILVSAGAACHTGSESTSVLAQGLGLSAEQGAELMRWSVGWTTTAEDIEAAITALNLCN